MIEKKISCYQSKRMLWIYGIADLCLPLIILLCIQSFIGLSPWNEAYTMLGLFSGVFFVLSTQLLGGYRRSLDRSIAKVLEVIFKSWLSSIVIIFFLAYLDYSVFDFARAVVLIWVVITPAFIFTIKVFVTQKSRIAEQGCTDVFVVGSGYEFNKSELSTLQRYNIRLHILLDYDAVAIRQAIEVENPDLIVINLDKAAKPILIKELTHLDLKGIQLITLNHFMESFLRKCYIPYKSVGLSYLDQISSFSTINFLIKRLVDISASVTLAMLAFPVMLFAIFRIKRESPGPVIFSQKRVGFSGQEHTIYKFRSMHLDAERNGAQFATADDPRAYEFGAFMRKTRIDELPQLWNVIKGDLHFVGPRPERKVFTDQLEEEIPYYNERHLVSPGVTGWAQVMYPYGANTEDARQKLMYDLYYIKHWSIWLEIETLIRTAFVVLGRKGL